MRVTSFIATWCCVLLFQWSVCSIVRMSGMADRFHVQSCCVLQAHVRSCCVLQALCDDLHKHLYKHLWQQLHQHIHLAAIAFGGNSSGKHSSRAFTALLSACQIWGAVSQGSTA